MKGNMTNANKIHRMENHLITYIEVANKLKTAYENILIGNRKKYMLI